MGVSNWGEMFLKEKWHDGFYPWFHIRTAGYPGPTPSDLSDY